MRAFRTELVNPAVSSRQAFAEIDARKIANDEADKELTQWLNGNGHAPAGIAKQLVGPSALLDGSTELALTPAELIAEHTGNTDFLPTSATGVKGSPTWENTNDDGARIYVLGDEDGDEWHVEARVTHLGQPEVQFYATIAEGGSTVLFRSPQAAAVFGGNILAAAIEAEQLAASWGKA